MILRFILFAVLAVWVFRVGGSILRLLFSNRNTSSFKPTNTDQNFQKSESKKKTQRSAGNYRGGEYIDYEDVEP